MPTFREDLHLGHKTTLVETDDISNGAITEEKLADSAVTEPKLADNAVTERSVSSNTIVTRHLQDYSVTNPKIADQAVDARTLKDSEVGWQKLNPDLQGIIASREEGGVALSKNWGNSELIGITQKKLSEAHEDLQSQIDAIVSEKATVSLAASVNIFIVGERTFTLTASTNTNAENITIKQGSTVIKTGSGKTLAQSVTVNQATAGNIVYTAEFTFAGGNKRTTTATVYFVNKVYVGAGNNVEDAAVDANAVSARRSINPNGNNGTNYTVTVTDDKPYVFFIMPASFTGIDHATMNGFAYNLTPVATTVIEGVNYKYYRCDVPMDAGTYNILIY